MPVDDQDSNAHMLTWDPAVPIYRQLRDRTVALILEGGLRAGDPLPSVRQMAVELQVNPLTISKAYQGLLDEGWVERRRGLGWFVLPDAPARLRERELAHFFHEEWPQFQARLRQLGISLTDVQAHEALASAGHSNVMS